MSHQPFETWLLDESGTLSQEERRALQAHLASCGQCQRLAQKWQAVQGELKMRRMVSPASGFAQRWQASLAERRARDQRRQAWKIFGALLGVALLTLLALAGYLLATTTPAEWLESLVKIISSTNVFFQYSIFVLLNWLSSTPLVVNIVLWIYLTLTLCFLMLVWVTILWRTRIVGALDL